MSRYACNSCVSKDRLSSEAIALAAQMNLGAEKHDVC